MRFDIITIFPELLRSPLQEGIIHRALRQGKIEVNLVNLRDFARDIHHTTDDRPFGGGEGMVMKAEPLSAAVAQCRAGQTEQAAKEAARDSAKCILLSPQGKQYNQQKAQEYANIASSGHYGHLILVCGRYEGVDERFIQRDVDEELSIGDYILTGGELAAMVVVDSVTRLLPEVLGCPASKERDTFSRRLLKHPQYTRPREFAGCEVPKELLSGNHLQIEQYRFLESVRVTLRKRPQLLIEEKFTPQECALLEKDGLLAQVRHIQKTVQEGVA